MSQIAQAKVNFVSRSISVPLYLLCFIFWRWQNFLHLFSIDRGRKRHDISDKLLAISTIHWLSDTETPLRAPSEERWLRDRRSGVTNNKMTSNHTSEKYFLKKSKLFISLSPLSSNNMRIFLIVITFIFCKIARFENLASNNGRCKLKHFLSESLQLRTPVLKITGN